MKNIDDLLDVFTGDYNLEDCACTYCVFNRGRGMDCGQECSFADEKRMILEREASVWGE